MRKNPPTQRTIMKISNGIEKVKDYRRNVIIDITNAMTAHNSKKRINRIIETQAKLDKMIADMQYVNMYRPALVPATIS